MRPEAIMFISAYGVLVCWAIYMVARALSTPSSSGRGYMEGERHAGYNGQLPAKAA
jgi:hypothetical protein